VAAVLTLSERKVGPVEVVPGFGVQIGPEPDGLEQDAAAELAQ
jgi:hypothetical protein